MFPRPRERSLAASWVAVKFGHGQQVRAKPGIESLLFFCCYLPPDIRLGFARIIRNGERTRLLR